MRAKVVQKKKKKKEKEKRRIENGRVKTLASKQIGKKMLFGLLYRNPLILLRMYLSVRASGES